MSLSEESIRGQLEGLAKDAQAVAQAFADYSENVKTEICSILKTAGVLDVVQEMELEREEVRKEAQAKLDALKGTGQELTTVLNYLQKSSKKATPVDPVLPTPVAVAPEVVPPEPLPEPLPEPIEVVVPEVVVPKAKPPTALRVVRPKF